MIAADIMTENPTTVEPTDALSHAVELLHTLNVRHLPVVDERGMLVGMLSDRDLGPLMRTLIEGVEIERMVVPVSQRQVADFMTGGVVTVTPEADVSEVIDLMLTERIGAVPVVDEADNVCGIISYVDVLRAIGAPEGRPGRATSRAGTGAAGSASQR
jgi:CBS domain-containing protein